MRLGIISDTHGRLAATQVAVKILRDEGVTEVIHCGDIGSAGVVACFDGLSTHFVLGNVDRDEDHTVAAIRAAGHSFHGRFGNLEREYIRIAFLHGDDSRRFDREISAETWDLICHGHTHVAERRTVGRTLILNPGAVHRAAVPSVATVEIPSLEVRFFGIRDVG
jgi:putative phosphoesterase